MTATLKTLSGIAVLSVLLSACATAPRKPFSPSAAPPNSAALYFYRPSEMTARLIRPTISANGATLGDLRNDSYGVVFLAPGQIQLLSAWPGLPGSRRQDSATLNVEAGKSYYLRVRYHATQAHGLVPHSLIQFENRAGLEEVAETDAIKQMAGMDASFEPEKAAP
jgi:hypothetical protein